MENITDFNTLLNFLSDSPSAAKLWGIVLSIIAGSGVFSFLRRPKSTSQGEVSYFSDDKLLSPPMRRPAYSDRMAYVLAEMSALAYYPFEGSGGVVIDAARDILNLANGDESKAREWLEEFADELLIKGVDSKEFLNKILEKSSFELLKTINVAETQAFACKRVAQGEDPYIVIAFRGTEQKVSDWLTDARAVPTVDGSFKVHTGFREALMLETNPAGQTALAMVEEILDMQASKDANGDLLPVFVTGHSLGGALALLTTRELALNITGACYTYGAPRVANYEYFEGMKTPVFRVVNSADIVPRVPPGAITVLVVNLVRGLSWITGFMPMISKLFDKLEVWLDKLNGYRHYGDQRYLTDVQAGRFETVKLLSNPPAIDRVIWMGQQIAVTFLAPVKSHGMAIYRKKLGFIANARNRSL
jgi:triacylglycerol lipase